MVDQILPLKFSLNSITIAFFYSNLYEVGWDVKACGWGDKSMAVKKPSTLREKNIDVSLSKAYDINFKFSRPMFILNISIYAPA